MNPVYGSLEKVYQEFNRRLSPFGTVVLAGGCVRDLLMNCYPKDYDVFVLGKITEDQLDAVSGALSDMEIVESSEFHNSEPYLVRTVRYEGAIVQIMCSEYPDVDKLLDSFDWNVSRFAFSGTPESIKQLMSVDLILPGQPLELHKITFPTSSLRRGFRFSERFGMKINDGDLHKLCVAVLAQQSGLWRNQE